VEVTDVAGEAVDVPVLFRDKYGNRKFSHAASGVARGGAWGFKAPPLKKECIFYCLVIGKTVFKLAFVQSHLT